MEIEDIFENINEILTFENLSEILKPKNYDSNRQYFINYIRALWCLQWLERIKIYKIQDRKLYNVLRLDFMDNFYN